MKFTSNKVKQLGLNPIQKFHTPFLQLDFSLGKGFGEGVWIETFAPEGLGKTTLMLQSISQYLIYNDNSYLLLLDVEKALDYTLIEMLFYQDNVEIDYEDNKIYIDGNERGTIVMPDTYDEIEAISEEFFKWCMENKCKGVILWDSLVSAISKEVQQKGMGKIGYKATAIQEYIERFLSLFRKIPVTLFVVNQIRDKLQTFMLGQDKSVGGMIDGDYHVPGGRAHKFFAFQTLMLVTGKKWQYSSTTDKLKGQIVKIFPTKNKQAPSKRQVDLIRIDDYGFSSLISLLEFLKSHKVVSGTCGQLAFSEEFGIKRINLEKLLDLLLDDENFFNLFFDTCFDLLLIYYKESKRVNFYDKNIQKSILKSDIIKLKKHLEFINTSLDNISSRQSNISVNSLDIDNVIDSEISNIDESLNDSSNDAGENNDNIDNSSSNDDKNKSSKSKNKKKGKKS